MNTQTMNEKPMTQQQANDYLEGFDGELVKVGAEAVREVGSVKITTEANETALRTFATDGTGLLSAVNATNYLDGLDKLIFGKWRPNEAVAHNERATYFSRVAEKQIALAKDSFVKTHAAKLATALDSIIAARSKARDVWREELSGAISNLETQLRLGTGLGSDPEADARQVRANMGALEAQLATKDMLDREARRLTAKMRTSPNLETLNEARGFIAQLVYE